MTMNFGGMANIIWIISLVISMAACKKESVSTGNSASYLELTLNGNLTRQTIHSFGASDAWSCQFIGNNWPDSKKNQIADWLFSTELDVNNSPKGIGLSTWRFNIGGGSIQQGSASGISDEWRRAESFMNNDKTYNWNSHQGQRWFLSAAKERGVNEFIGFVNSPPVAITKNRKAYSSDKNHHNLDESNYELFANYLADIVENVQANDGILFKYISPFNEPQWDWTDGGQEGTPAQNSEISTLTKVINTEFDKRNLSTLLELPESAQLNFLYENDNKKGRGEQVSSFFNPSSSEYIGNLSHVAPKVAAHSYYTTWPLSRLSETRMKVKQAVEANSSSIEFWMTEYCVLENNSEISGNGRDLSMNTALYTARVIFTDLCIGNASSWQWWLAVSPYDYKDGLVYTDYNKNDGAIYDSKLLWSFGNFSRFIIPGMTRLAITRSDSKTEEQSLDNLMAGAFVNEDKSKASVVLINYRDSKIPVKISLKEIVGLSGLKVYLTDGKSENNLAYQGDYSISEVIEIPPRSVVTITNVD